VTSKVAKITLVIILSSAIPSCRWREANSEGEAQRTHPESRPERTAGLESYADVVDLVAESVVTVRSARRTRAGQQFPFMEDPFFRRFFGEPFGRRAVPENRVERGIGSGVIVRDDGHVVTNHHVVDGAQEIRVEFANGASHEASVVGSDPPSDLAVLKIKAKDVRALALGDSDSVRVGDVVLAVGNPLGIGQTVTAGIISAKGRTTGLSDGSFEDFLQTDAPINRGNSGGALVNTAGELIGINSQIVSPTGGNIGIGFAIPANMAKDVMQQLIANGKVRRGQLGVTIQAITPELASAMDLKSTRGVLVADVQRGSPAERAGIRRGDIIVAVNGNAVESSNELRNRVSSMQPGTEVTLTRIREGDRADVKVRLGELNAAAAAGSQRRESPAQAQLGIEVQPLTPEMARQLGIEEAAGVVVRNVDPLGPAAEAGLRAGDVITQVNRRPVRSVAELREAAGDDASSDVLLLVKRRGATFFASVRPG
jgi:Do/DeqQ family serine protease